jgi:hypothetical protein
VGGDVQLTFGTSVASGFLICFLAHGIIRKLKSKTGIEDDPPLPPPPLMGA